MKRLSKLFGGLLGFGLGTVISTGIKVFKPDIDPATADHIGTAIQAVALGLGVYHAPANQ